MTFPRNTLLALAVVALAQTLVLGWMVIDRVWLLKTGREITLPVEPVDPRDLFRGEYVRLGYPISRVPLTSVAGAPIRRNEALYVVLEKAEDGWRPIEVSRTFPPAAGPDRVVLKARSLWDAPALEAGAWRGGAVRYGIESYFVPEGQGRQLEAMARERKLAVLVAVDRAGNAAIKGLIIDGKLQYEEPLL